MSEDRRARECPPSYHGWIFGLVIYLFVGGVLLGCYASDLDDKCPGTSAPTPSESAAIVTMWLPVMVGTLIDYHKPTVRWKDTPCPK